ncbi:MAG: 2-C-methyl-D-erythritol 4-phosphate cytidylyltransferase [Xanthomonadales bacterium]|nr:2-C-methyl-D-erythritol 4-phosphate cytidylyltransferase [Xanthomonadales bacterium]
MAIKAKRTQAKVSAIIDARSRMPDGTLIASLKLGREHLLDRQLRLMPTEVDECCIVGADDLAVGDRFEPASLHRVSDSDGMSALSSALEVCRGATILLFSAAQPFPDVGDSHRVLAALRKRPAAGVFQSGRMSLARAQGETVLSATPSDHYWTTQWPLGFERALLTEVLAAAEHTAGADGMTVCELTLRLGHAIGLIEGRRSGFLIRDVYDWMLAQALAAQTRAAA